MSRRQNKAFVLTLAWYMLCPKRLEGQALGHMHWFSNIFSKQGRFADTPPLFHLADDLYKLIAILETGSYDLFSFLSST